VVTIGIAGPHTLPLVLSVPAIVPLAATHQADVSAAKCEFGNAGHQPDAVINPQLSHTALPLPQEASTLAPLR
jgi:hypothetical protein